MMTQYDGREVDVGGGGRELGDMEAVRRVNRLLREEEDEQAWWENNRNTNLRHGVRVFYDGTAVGRAFLASCW